MSNRLYSPCGHFGIKSELGLGVRPTPTLQILHKGDQQRVAVALCQPSLTFIPKWLGRD